jgi:hypothetical protein
VKRETVSPQTAACNVAFKEWAGVCDALLQGRQTIILRKGGISEGAGPGVFVPEHTEFWLYPTWFHQAVQPLHIVAGSDQGQPAHETHAAGLIPIRALVRVDLVGYASKQETLQALEEFHVLTEDTIRKRFHYRKPGIWVLGARVWRRQEEVAIAATPEHAGCKTWVVLRDPLPTLGLVPVLDDVEWAARRCRLETILGEGQAPMCRPSLREHA